MLIDPAPRETPMSPGTAEAFFRYLVAARGLRLAYTLHARRRLRERGITADGVLRVLAEGRVMAKPRRCDGLGRSKYTLEGPVSEGGSRLLRMVVLGAPRSPMLRVVTVMWVDERGEAVED